MTSSAFGPPLWCPVCCIWALAFTSCRRAAPGAAALASVAVLAWPWALGQDPRSCLGVGQGPRLARQQSGALERIHGL
eukprot:7504092-Lingulodinium_polyedra.AAC.1